MRRDEYPHRKHLSQGLCWEWWICSQASGLPAVVVVGQSSKRSEGVNTEFTGFQRRDTLFVFAVLVPAEAQVELLTVTVTKKRSHSELSLVWNHSECLSVVLLLMWFLSLRLNDNSYGEATI